MRKHKNIFTDSVVTVIGHTTKKGVKLVNYINPDNPRKNVHGIEIGHSKPKYVFDATYKEVRR